MKSTPRPLHWALVLSLMAALPGFAQTLVTYTNGENKAGALSVTAPNDPTTVDAAAGNATQSGGITGTGNLIKTGFSTLLLTGTNTYTGTTTINEGALQFAAPASLA